MKIHKIAGALCALQSVTKLGSKCNQTSPLKNITQADSQLKNIFIPTIFFLRVA